MAEPPGFMNPLWDIMNKYHIIEFEQRIQNKILKVLGLGEDTSVADAVATKAAEALPPALAPPPTATTEAAIVEEPPRTISVSGFYKVTGPTELTFYATTTWPGFTVDAGWNLVGVDRKSTRLNSSHT